MSYLKMLNFHYLVKHLSNNYKNKNFTSKLSNNYKNKNFTSKQRLAKKQFWSQLVSSKTTLNWSGPQKKPGYHCSKNWSLATPVQ